MTPEQWARVFRAGAGAVQHVPDEYSPPALLMVLMFAMENEAKAIGREAGDPDG
jgi:hypothetical protein